MPAPSTITEFAELVQKSGVLDDKKLEAYLERLRSTSALPTEPAKLAGMMVRDGLLTQFQAEQFLLGKWRRFTIGKYKVLERLGSGGMGSVYLCEHKFMRRRVAVKVLPTAKADDASSLDRFYREARAVAALDHPNIVRAYDIDQDDKLHFLVMEYVDGVSLQEMVKKSGPLDVARACHYMRQAAVGLQHAHESAGLVHRDIKPGNVLVDRNGVVKILDMGLARFFHDEDDVITKKYDENVLGTADYLAPEQALDSHSVDIRADIYSLGGTFYYCLTGRTPFHEGTVAQKLIWHQTRQPKSIRTVRPDVSEEVAVILDKMMAKDRAARYQTPKEVAEALAPLTPMAIAPPPDAEMPRLSLAATGGSPTGEAATQVTAQAPGPPSPSKGWQVKTTPAPRPTPPPTPPPAPPPVRAPRTPAPAPKSAPRPAPSSSPSQPAAAPAPKNGQASSADLEAPAADGDPWGGLSSETATSARADTSPRSARHTNKSSISMKLRRPAVKPVSRWELLLHNIWFWVAVGAVVVAAGVAAIWYILYGPMANRPTAAVVVARPPLLVSPRGGPESYRTVADALKAAKAGDRIWLQDPVHEEMLTLDDKQSKVPRDIVIESADKANRTVWRVPPQAQPVVKVLQCNSVQGWQLRHVTFDGADRVNDVILVTGRCPGLTFEEVDVKGFKRCGILVSNCAGTPENPVSFNTVRVETKAASTAAFIFDINDRMMPKDNEHIILRGCRFDGPFTVPLQNKDKSGMHTIVRLEGQNVQQTDAKSTPVPVTALTKQ